jgi:cytochrome c554/c'-like protein
MAAALYAQMATADRIQAAGWWPTKAAAARKDYVGAEACAACHRREAATQPATSMARTMTRAHASEPLRANRHLEFKSGGYAYEIRTEDSQSVYRVSDGDATLSAPLAWAFGVGKVGQSFLFAQDGSFHEARVSYYDGIRALDFTPARAATTPRTIGEAAARTVGAAEARRCFACHATAPSADGVFDPDAATPGVTCEACHGPGRAHVEAMRDRRTGDGRAAILNPAKLEPVDIVDFCGACHATFWDVKLADEKGIAALRSQPYRLLSSRCWNGGDRRLTCVTCHNPHVPLVRDAAAYDARCLSCHAARGAAADAAHTAPACTVAAGGCVTCHMPKYEVPEMHHAFTDHLIRVVRSR